jgi:serine/threonine protein kinase
LRILERIAHPFIVQLKYAFHDKSKLFLVLHYCPGGELFFYLNACKRFKEDVVAFYCSNILLAIKCLHENNIVYRDLKPENILIDSEGYANLTDFGLSKDNIGEKKATSLCGTADYIAPELLKQKRSYGQEVDWWSFGCLIYDMLTGRPPFFGESNKITFEKIQN